MTTLDPGGVPGRTRPETPKKKRDKRGYQRRQTLEPAANSPLMTIPAAGRKYFGLSKNGSYDAAERGEFGRLYEVGRRRFVVVANVEGKIQAATEAA
jgi:hypothetical protein